VGDHNPSDNASANYFGNMQSDGATYEIWQKERTNAPSIEGDNTDFQQYYQHRQPFSRLGSRGLEAWDSKLHGDGY
jgi:hypothetical protein